LSDVDSLVHTQDRERFGFGNERLKFTSGGQWEWRLRLPLRIALSQTFKVVANSFQCRIGDGDMNEVVL
jgi:hypothetical protein